MSDEWAKDIDYDQQHEAYDALYDHAETLVDEGMHPEQIGMLLNIMKGSFRGKASSETKLSGEHRLQHKLWEVVREVEQSDDWDLDWYGIAFVLYEMYEMSRSFARRTDGDLQ